jgi:predicted molibdopterin-dependent oxidoreductase YjgC
VSVPRFVRVAETGRAPVRFRLDGSEISGLDGDSVLTAVLTNADHVRISEFSAAARAGFCLMGACQDCWMWMDDGDRLRACTTPVKMGLALRTTPPETGTWPTTRS